MADYCFRHLAALCQGGIRIPEQPPDQDQVSSIVQRSLLLRSSDRTPLLTGLIVFISLLTIVKEKGRHRVVNTPVQDLLSLHLCHQLWL